LVQSRLKHSRPSMLNIAIEHGMDARLDGTGWALRALQMGWRPVLGRWLEQQLGWWLEHLEWMPTRLDGAGWKMRALSIRTVRQAANLLAER